VLNLVPLAALAAILIYVGWKLAHPIHLLQAWRIGRDQFVPFTVTIVAILLTDLLVGVIIGLLVGAFFILKEQADAPGLTILSPPGSVLTGTRWASRPPSSRRCASRRRTERLRSGSGWRSTRAIAAASTLTCCSCCTFRYTAAERVTSTTASSPFPTSP
jgi:hypothetical protein